MQFFSARLKIFSRWHEFGIFGDDLIKNKGSRTKGGIQMT